MPVREILVLAYSCVLFFEIIWSGSSLIILLDPWKDAPFTPHWSPFIWFQNENALRAFLFIFLTAALVAWNKNFKSLAHLSFGLLWVAFFQAVPLIYNPGLPFLIWMHFAFAFLHWDKESSSKIQSLAILLFAFGYFFSGIDKFLTPSWQNGRALDAIFSGIYGAWPWMLDIWMNIPEMLRRLLTWGIPVVEMSALLYLIPKFPRRFLWWLILSLQILNLVFLNLAMVAIPMIIFQIFIFSHIRPLRPSP